MQLRPYQSEIITSTRESLRHNRSTLVVAATGAGKTALTVHMMATAAERGISSMFCVHRDTLLSQTSRALWEQKLQHGIIAAGRNMSLGIPVQVASVQTLVRRLDRVAEPGLIIIDEAHRAAADTYRKIIEAYPKSRIVGLTATPQRTDGKGLNDIFTDMVLGPSVGELIEQGFLCPYRLYGTESKVSMDGVKTRMGDYAPEILEQIVDKPTVTGDAVEHYLKFAYGKRCVVMCATINHAKHVCEAYNSAGISAEHIDGDTPSSERQAILGRIKEGKTKVLTNVELMIEGVDVPAIEVVQWLRPTASLIIWMQGNGRGFRTADNKPALMILDHVGNWQRHGLPDDEREWRLEGDPNKGKRKKPSQNDLKIRQCPECYAIYRAGLSECPSCGKEGPKQREIKVEDGELQQIDIEAQRKQKKREQGSARTLKDLVELGKRRGLNKPAEWAVMIHAARIRARPTPAMFTEARGYL